MLRALLAVPVLLLLAVPSAHAAAKPDPDIKKLFDAQITAVLDGSDADFLAGFTADAVVWIQGSELAARPADLVTAYRATWTDRMDAVQKIKASGLVATPLSGTIAFASLEWATSGQYEADKRYTWSTPWRITAILARADESAPWKIRAAFYSTPALDSNLIEKAQGDYGTKPTALPGAVAVDGKWIGDWFKSGATWKAAPEDFASVFGSAAKEKAVGGKKVAAQLKKWKGLGFAVSGDVVSGSESPLYWMMANVDVTLTVKKKPLVIHLRLMLVMLEEGETGEIEVLSAHFADYDY